MSSQYSIEQFNAAFVLDGPLRAASPPDHASRAKHPKYPDYSHCTSWQERTEAGQRHAQSIKDHYATKRDDLRKADLLAIAERTHDPFAHWQALFDAGMLVRGGGMPTPQPAPAISHPNVLILSFEQAFTCAAGSRVLNTAASAIA